MSKAVGIILSSSREMRMSLSMHKRTVSMLCPDQQADWWVLSRLCVDYMVTFIEMIVFPNSSLWTLWCTMHRLQTSVQPEWPQEPWDTPASQISQWMNLTVPRLWMMMHLPQGHQRPAVSAVVYAQPLCLRGWSTLMLSIAPPTST